MQEGYWLCDKCSQGLIEFAASQKSIVKQTWRQYHKDWGLGDQEYEVGDVVTRDGSDEHIILWIDYDWLTMEVECIKEPRILPPVEKGDKPWILKGEKEINLIRRYQLVRKR